MKSKLLAALLFSTVLATTPLLAKDKHDQSDTYTTDHNIGGIEIIGEIDAHTASVVHEAFSEFKKRKFTKVVIHLNSEGGNVDAGEDIVKDILSAENDDGMQVSTYVDHREFCASMCTAVFAAGNFRVGAWDSRWAFHSPSVDLSDEEKKDPEIQKEVKEEINISRQFLMTMYEKVDPAWADKVLKPYIMSDNSDRALRLTGAQIVDTGSPWWFDYILEEDLTGNGDAQNAPTKMHPPVKIY